MEVVADGAELNRVVGVAAGYDRLAQLPRESFELRARARFPSVQIQKLEAVQESGI
ncbi:hypothetical protein D3C71_2185330 [compost metagenome]